MKVLVVILSLFFFLKYGNAQVEMNITTNPLGRTNGIKVDLFGLLRGYSQISYEKFLSPTSSIELSLGIIGLGANHALEYSDSVISAKANYKSQSGFFISAGYKFNRISLLEIGRTERTSVLQGLYAKPVIYFGRYEENRIAITNIQQRTYELKRPTTTFGALQIELGKEWVIKDQILIDGYVGIGYCLDNKDYYSSSYYTLKTTSAFNYCNQRIGTSPGISTTFGIKVGYLF